jgi:signal transduction histidine kinase
VHSNALARREERERISLRLHDSVIQRMVSAFHMVEAIRETNIHKLEQAAILQKAEEVLSQAIRELREVINALHSAAPGPEANDW